MDNPLKIFYVNPMSYGNLALYDYSLLSNVKNIDLRYFCNTKYDSDQLNFKFEKIYNYSDKNRFFKIISYIKSQFVLFKAIKHNSANIIHFQWLKIPSVDYILLKRINKKGIKNILTAHNILPHNTGNRYEKIYKKIYSIVDIIIVHTPNTRTELMEKFHVSSNKIYVIPHGILNMGQNIDSTKILSYVNRFRSECNLDKKIVFSALGNIHNYKGYDLILDTWKQDNISENDSLQLIIAGKGKLKKIEEIKELKNVTLINRFLEDEEFLALLRLTDFVLLPYKKISQSGILLTVLNEKKRVIVSNVGGLADPFKFGKIGYVLSDYSTNELNNTIVRASLNKKDYPREEIWEKILEYYNWENIGLATQEMYYKI